MTALSVDVSEFSRQAKRKRNSIEKNSNGVNAKKGNETERKNVNVALKRNFVTEK
jgi:predicted ATP-grasp superfamily ATP-dependent carboligase